MSANDKTVLITGGSSGIGYDVARGFLQKGANVLLNGRNPEKLSKAAESLGHPARVAVVPGDIGDRATGESMVRVALERFGSVDVLVNNAGTFSLKPFLEVTEEDLDGFINGNLKGTYFTTQAVVRQMREQGGGCHRQHRHRVGRPRQIGSACLGSPRHEGRRPCPDNELGGGAGSRQHPRQPRGPRRRPHANLW